MLIDTHCHLHDHEYGADPDEAIAHAIANDVRKIIVIGTAPYDSVDACNFAASHQDVFWTYGYHPHEFNGDIAQLEADLKTAHETRLKQPKLVGIGEVGLDYHYPPFDRGAQIVLLEHMLQIAQDYKLPVSFHVRDAFEDFWPIFDNFHLVPSVLHSFSDSEENLRAGLDRGLYTGVNGLSTFAKIPHAPLERVIFETDAPYLTPKQFRGTINKPGYVKLIAEWAAEYYHVSPAEVAQITTANAERIFKI